MVDFLELLRLRGGAVAKTDYFLGPAWCLDKPAARAAIMSELERRDTWQGRKYEA